MQPERRECRSQVPSIAIDLCLAGLRARAGIRALVLSDDKGRVIAGCGDETLAEQIAERAPRVASGQREERTIVGVGVMQVRGFDPPIFAACSRDVRDVSHLLKSAGAGARRILAARANLSANR